MDNHQWDKQAILVLLPCKEDIQDNSQWEEVIQANLKLKDTQEFNLQIMDNH
jgi:hypothetical protein